MPLAVISFTASTHAAGFEPLGELVANDGKLETSNLFGTCDATTCTQDCQSCYLTEVTTRGFGDLCFVSAGTLLRSPLPWPRTQMLMVFINHGVLPGLACHHPRLETLGSLVTPLRFSMANII